MFFFSGRRRHTMCIGDWSSDVCSSDLIAQGAEQQRLRDRLGFTRLRSAATGGAALGPDTFKFFQAMGVPRSEERRVGKECRARWWAYSRRKGSKQASTVIRGAHTLLRT